MSYDLCTAVLLCKVVLRSTAVRPTAVVLVYHGTRTQGPGRMSQGVSTGRLL